LADINATGLTILLVEQDVTTAFEVAETAFVIETGRTTRTDPPPTDFSHSSAREGWVFESGCAAILSRDHANETGSRNNNVAFFDGLTFYCSNGSVGVSGFSLPTRANLKPGLPG